MTSGLPTRRIDAVRLREKFYFPNKECKNGQIDVWLTSRSACWCVDCRRQHSSKVNEWQKANPQKVLPRLRSWREANPERVVAQSKKHAEKRRSGELLRREGDPVKRYYRNSKRRKAVKIATPPWADLEAIKAIYLEAGRRRAACEDVHVDHIYPLQGETVCGLHVAENLQIIPAAENLRKCNSLLRVGAECDAHVRGLQGVVMATRQVKDGNEQ